MRPRRPRRPSRVLLAAAAALSLLLAATATTLWVRNLLVSDRLTWFVHDGDGALTHFWSASSWWGSLVLERSVMREPVQPTDAPRRRKRVIHSQMPDARTTPPFSARDVRIVAGFGWGQYGFALQSDERVLNFAPGTSTVLLVPWYAIVLLTGVPPIVWLAAGRRRRHRARKGLCARCGYDLRESPTRCPECGTRVEPEK